MQLKTPNDICVLGLKLYDVVVNSPLLVAAVPNLSTDPDVLMSVVLSFLLLNPIED